MWAVIIIVVILIVYFIYVYKVYKKNETMTIKDFGTVGADLRRAVQKRVAKVKEYDAKLMQKQGMASAGH